MGVVSASMPMTSLLVNMKPLRLVVAILVSLLSVAAVNVRQAGTPAVVYERFHIETDIVARYGTTRITSVVLNSAAESQELAFSVQLPSTAFISNFTMEVNGRTYYGIAAEKQQAAEEFEEQQEAGNNAGLVEASGGNVFEIRINTAANSRATFELSYEELLTRQLSRYRKTVTLNPSAIVQDYQVNIRVYDEQGIDYLRASDFVQTQRPSSNEALFSYQPTIQNQNEGLDEELVIEYDVHHPSDGAGLVVVSDCYFAQFFSPSGVEAIPVDVVFVIDVSGSMQGMKIAQTRVALETIIQQLRETDRFTMVTFENNVATWRDRLVPVPGNRAAGVDFARGLEAGGGTNFAGGMQTGINILKTYGISTSVQSVVMLTDGHPTAGITNEEAILSLAADLLIGETISVHCLGFGLNLNFELLQQLALSNNGIARQIFEGSSAADQLEGFFEEISSPILRDIVITYPEGSLETVSNLQFPLLFNGSELVIAGKFSAEVCVNNPSTVPVTVIGTSSTSQRTFQSDVQASVDSAIAPATERLAAYLLIQQLLEQRLIAEDSEAVAAIEAEALQLALSYNFVTELTSLLVVEEGGNSTLDEDYQNYDDDAYEDFALYPGGIPSAGPDPSNPSLIAYCCGRSGAGMPGGSLHLTLLLLVVGLLILQPAAG